jgi:hypothetical protein
VTTIFLRDSLLNMDNQHQVDKDALQQFNFSDPLTEKDISTIEKFLDRAYDIRKFEIEMYWKRATYFWGFIAASYTLFFLISSTKINLDSKKIATLQLLVTSLGLVFSYGWYIVNRGSKFWTKNWHEIIDFLEDKINKPFHRLTIKDDSLLLNVFSYYRFSVTDTNLIISFFNVVVWVIVVSYNFSNSMEDLNFSNNLRQENVYILIATFTILLILTFQKYLKKKKKITIGVKQKFA